jgi:hypothetical protein
MIFQNSIDQIDLEVSELLAQVEAKKQRQSQLIELEALTDDTLEGLAAVVSKIACYEPDAIASLKTAVLGLFDGDNGIGDDSGNQPTDPTPNNGDDGEPELIALNGETGECLTTADLQAPIPDNPVGDEQSCSINPDLYWAITTTPDGSAWDFASPLACLLEDCPESSLIGQACDLATPFACPINPQPRPLASQTEMIHLSSTCGYLKLKEDGRILAAYAWFSRKAIAEAWASQLEVIPSAKIEMRESKRNSSWKWELKITGLTMQQIDRLASEKLHQKPKKAKATETPAQAAGLEPPGDWGKVQQPEESTKLPPCPFVEGDIVDWNGCKLRVEKIGVEKLYCVFPHEPEGTKHHTTVLINECTPVLEAEPQPELTISIVGEGDICEVIEGRYIGQLGTIETINNYSEIPIALNLPGNHIKHFHRSELKLVSKVEPAKRKPLKAGRVLLGNRIVTTGNYFGVARRNAILNARNGISDKIAVLRVMKDLEADGLDPTLALDDAADF